MEKPSGDEGVGRGQHANEGILAGALSFFFARVEALGVPSPGNSKEIRHAGWALSQIQLVGLEGRDDGVDLFGGVFQLCQSSPVLDVGLESTYRSQSWWPLWVRCLPILVDGCRPM